MADLLVSFTALERAERVLAEVGDRVEQLAKRVQRLSPQTVGAAEVQGELNHFMRAWVHASGRLAGDCTQAVQNLQAVVSVFGRADQQLSSTLRAAAPPASRP